MKINTTPPAEQTAPIGRRPGAPIAHKREQPAYNQRPPGWVLMPQRHCKKRTPDGQKAHKQVLRSCGTPPRGRSPSRAQRNSLTLQCTSCIHRIFGKPTACGDTNITNTIVKKEYHIIWHGLAQNWKVAGEERYCANQRSESAKGHGFWLAILTIGIFGFQCLHP